MADPKASPQAPSAASSLLDAELAAQQAPGAPQAAQGAGIDPASAALDAALTAQQGTGAPVSAPAGATPAPGQVPDPGTSTIQGVIDTTGRVISDVATGVTELPRAMTRGTIEAVHQTTDKVSGLLDRATHVLGLDDKKSALGMAYALSPLGQFHATEQEVAKATGRLNAGIDKPTSVTGGLAEGATQFAVGMIGAGKLFKAAGILEAVTVKGIIGQGMAKGALVDALVFDPLGERLSNFMEDNGISSQFTRYLMAKPTDTKAEGMFKNVLEGLMLGGATETVLRGTARAYKLFKHGDVAGARKETVDFTGRLERLTARVDAEAAKDVPAPHAPDVSAPPLDAAVTPIPRADPNAPVPVERLTAVLEAARGHVDEAEVQRLKAGWESMGGATEAQVRRDLEKSLDGNVERAGDILSQADAATAKKADVMQTGHAAELATDKPVADAPALPAPKLDLLPPDRADSVIKAMNSRWTYGRGAALSANEFNFTRFTDPEDFHAIVSAISPHMQDMIAKRTGGKPRPLADVLKTATRNAETFGVSPETMLANIKATGKNVAHLDSDLVTYDLVMRSVVEQAASAAASALRPGVDPAAAALAHAEAINGARLAAAIIAENKGIETNVARALSAKRIPIVGKDTAMSFTQLLESAEKHGISDADKAMLKQLSMMGGDPKKLRRYLEASYLRRAGDSFIEYFYNSLLSGPKTQIVNFVTNSMNTAYGPMERAVAGFMPGGVGGREALARMVDEYHGLMYSLWDSMKAAGTVLKSGTPLLDEAGKSAAERAGTDRNALSSHRWGLSREVWNADGTLSHTETTPIIGHFVDGIGQAINLPSRSLATQDELFKNLAYRSYLYTQASAEARGRGMKGEARAQFIADEMENGFERNGVGINKEGLQRAREVTFTQDLEYGVGQWVQQGVGRFPPFRLVVPFVRTPTNLLRWTWQRTPIVQFAQRQFLEDFKAGGQRRADSMAKMTTGGAMYALATYMASNDMITGGGPLDPDLNKAWQASGKLPYSFKMKDGSYVSYNRGDPFFMPIGLAADFVDMAGHMNDKQLDEIGGAMLTSLARNLMSKSYMQGMMNLFTGFSDWVNGRSKAPLDNWAQRLAGSVVVPSVIANFKGEDAAQREVYSTMDAIRNRLPDNFLGLGNKGQDSLPMSYNIFGEKTAPSSFLGPDNWSPLASREAKHDPIADELVEVMYKVDHAFGKPSYLLGDTHVDLRNLRTDDGKKNAYERYNELIGTLEGGVRQSLTELMSTPDYRQAGYGDKDFPTSPGSRLWMVQKVLQAHREAARDQLLAENPKLLDVYTQEQTRALTTGTQGPQAKAYTPPTFIESVIGKKQK